MPVASCSAWCFREDNQTGRDHVIADIKFEQACILYNIGALHSNLGAIDTRQNAEVCLFVVVVLCMNSFFKVP